MKLEKSGLFLEVTFRGGRPWAAYLQLPRTGGQRVVRSRREEHGMVVDLARDGTPLGIEFTAPGAVKPQLMLRTRGRGPADRNVWSRFCSSSRGGNRNGDADLR
jgi:hypothetical protein